MEVLEIHIYSDIGLSGQPLDQKQPKSNLLYTSNKNKNKSAKENKKTFVMLRNLEGSPSAKHNVDFQNSKQLPPLRTKGVTSQH